MTEPVANKEGSQPLRTSILVVDDSRSMRDLIVVILQGAGYDCTPAEHVDAAMAHLAADKFSLVLCDIEMPGRDGTFLLKLIRSAFSDTYVVMLTSVTNPEVVMKCMHLGANDYLMKPFTPERLLVTVGNALEQRRLFLEHRSYEENLEQKVQEQTEQIRITLTEKALITKEMEIAKEIQSALIPLAFPTADHLAFAAHYRPAGTLGGDYFDVFPREDGIIDVVIADVAGHNIGSALIVAEMRGAFQVQHAASCLSCGDMLGLINESFHDDLTRAGLFVSMFYIRLDERNMQLRYACAGHNPLLYIRADGSVEELDADGMIIGVVPRIEFEEKSLPLAIGDRLVLYTDGIIEAENQVGKMFGLNKLAASFTETRRKESDEALGKALSSVQDFTAGVPLKDDLSLVVVTVR